MKTETEDKIKFFFIVIVELVLVALIGLFFTGCSTYGKPVGITRAPMYVVTNTTSSVTTTGTNVSSVVNTQTQSFLKPQRRWSLVGLVFGEKDPIPTTVPSGQSVQQGYPAPQITVVESPYSYRYGYSGGYGGYRSPYQPVYGGYCSSERRLFGVRFRTR